VPLIQHVREVGVYADWLGIGPVLLWMPVSSLLLASNQEILKKAEKSGNC
jgi:hypothetical protein